ncbi:ubiquinol-cytochrome C chaperone family protein [Telmatospirillum siberiense]|uniref:Ubiquinol-cytochrome c chaperone domain-containing protein n=1 Tax=Telmatospirillum siberiense TaxID=382514 RepID=A0A2N3PYT7_9PROT|nr:ubiquinol-cytochrome C chaperone family protein [Telmatospirillum siberiense]PKU25563.1 hypothetical protein CWS72_05735 [Telmatospirillum siberiense]
MVLRSLFSRGRVAEAGQALYAAAVRQARREEFYLSFGVPDSVDGRFDLLALHVFLLLHRLGKSGRPAKALSQVVFDLMFADMEANLREMGVSDMAVGGRVKTMAKAFYGRIAAYEPGLEAASGDPAVLRDALARNLYRGEPVEERALDAMAAYVRRSDAILIEQSLDDLRDGKVRFAAPMPEDVVPS